MVTARVDETEVDAAEAILNQHSPIDTASRRREYEASGWSSFNDEDDAEVIYDDDRPMGSPVVTPFPR